MIKKLLTSAFVLGTYLASAQCIPFQIASHVWQDSLGSQRLIIQVDKDSKVVEVNVDWRRRDRDAASKAIIITDSIGNQIKNLFIKNNTRESGDILFQPTAGKGKYFVYYYPWSGHKWEGGFEGDYLRKQIMPESDWSKLAQTIKEPQKVTVLAIEARTAFDSFYPMEVVAKQSEVKALKAKYTDPYLCFMEDRKNPIRMFDDLPYKWIQSGPSNHFKATAKRNEYYVFQVGIYASEQSLQNIQVRYQDAPFAITCFNTGGIDANGKPFIKKLDLEIGKVQPLWFGIDIPKNAKPGKRTCKILIQPENGPQKVLTLNLDVTDQILEDRGDDSLWKMSRLRWLNSTLGEDEKNTREQSPLQIKAGGIHAGKASVELDQFGLPKQIQIDQKQILNTPIAFFIDSNWEKTARPDPIRYTKKATGLVSWTTQSENDQMKAFYEGSMESDGYIHYKITVHPKKSFYTENTALTITIKKGMGDYFMGMGSGKPFGRNGGSTPTSYDWKWHGPQNSYWIGDVDAGLYCKLLGATYNGPMLNLYHPAPPPSWFNANAGGFKISQTPQQIITSTYVGHMNWKKDSIQVFEFSLLITPVKQLDTKAQFSNRYFQNYGNPNPEQEDLNAGVKIINVHHANRINPYINYPFVRVDSMRAFVKKYHAMGVKTKIYYTIRELSNQASELWALRSLGTEIYGDGNGGGYTWLREHLVDHYNVQWFTPIDGYEACDAAILTSGQSRWYNYYIEGLKWLVKNVDIDGLYLDDVAFDRSMLKRMRKVMESVKPGCMIDLHSNTDFSKGPATQYTEFFPYIDKLWFGENFLYEKMQPDNWLVETSGIPFGLMGDMLFHGGNPYRGMVYGMTNRDGWLTDGIKSNPKPIWKALDDFGIKDATMIGYWQKNAIIQSSNPDIKATAYLNKHKLLIAIASWAKDTTEVQLKIDWKKLGFIPKSKEMKAMYITGFQKAASYPVDKTITLMPEKGLLLELE